MHRLLVPSGELAKDAPVLPKDAQNHLKVIRPKAGEEIELFDGRGSWRVFAVGASGRGIGLKPVSETITLKPSTSTLTLFACVTKGSRWDWTIEKATELGVSRILPVISERTIVRLAPDEREAKRLRWTRIAEDAARQSDAKWVPEILAPAPFAESLVRARETRCFVGALTTPEPQMILSALSVASSRSRADYSLFIGPEGDFSPDELKALLAFATPVSFGSTILRAETAAIYGLSVMKSVLDAARTA